MSGRRLEKEKVYQEYWASYINNLPNDDTVALDNNSEITLSDGTRCNVFYTEKKIIKKTGKILETKYAVECDFIDKMNEGVAQASRYALLTGRLPGLLIIMEGQNPDLEEKKLNQLKELLSCIRVKIQNGIDKLGRIKYKWHPIKLWTITYKDLPLNLKNKFS